MSNESVPASTAPPPVPALSTVLRESVPIAKLLLFWLVLAAIPLANLTFLCGWHCAFAPVFEGLLGFITLLGTTNVLLYVVARGVSLGRHEGGG